MIIGGGETSNGIVMVVVRSVVVVVKVVVVVHGFVCVQVSVSVVAVGGTSEQQAEEMVWDAQVNRAVGVGFAGWLAEAVVVAARLLMDGLGPL
jgi:hypothetical protein